MINLKDFYKTHNDCTWLDLKPAKWSKAWSIRIKQRDKDYADLYRTQLCEIIREHLNNGNSIGSIIGITNKDNDKLFNANVYSYMINYFPEITDLVNKKHQDNIRSWRIY